jgi:uncharacterized membrane protein
VDGAGIHYFPLSGAFLLLLSALLVLLLLLVVLHVLKYAYSRIGIAPQYFFSVLVLTLLGSYVNIPLLQFPEAHVLSPQLVTVYGIPYVVPLVEDRAGTLLAINVGGGLIPILLSLYLVIKNGIYKKAAWGVLIVAIACFVMATPVAGVGITIPIFYPPLITAVVAILLSRTYAAPLAYICGSIGTLIGADLLNLPLVAQMEAPVMSIGGAGTFDAIFITGLLAGLFASIGMKRGKALAR